MKMINRLFTPKAPPEFKPEEGQSFRMVFGNDTVKLTTTADMALAPALARVVKEITGLRAVVEQNKDARPVAVIEIEIERTQALQAEQRAAITFAQAQCRSGFIPERDIIPKQAAWNATHTVLRDLLAEKEKRIEGDTAKVELLRIMVACNCDAGGL